MSEGKKFAALFSVLLGILFLIVIVGRIYIVAPKIEPRQASSYTPAPARATTGLIYLEDADWDVKPGRLAIAGTVKNTSERKYRYVQIQFNLYDKNEAQIGSALANVNNLEPDGTWKFKAHVMVDLNDKSTIPNRFSFQRVSGY